MFRTPAAIRRTAAIRAGILAATLLALAGCSVNQRLMLDTASGHDPAARVNRVRWAEFTHDVAFPDSVTTLSPAAEQDLDAFLRRGRVAAPDKVFVVAQPRLASEARDRLAARREEAVRRHLEKRHLEPGVLPGKAPGPPVGTRNAVTVVVRRPLVKTPKCDDWKRLNAGEVPEYRHEDFGCITASALGAMVADPSDLQHGRALGPGDGEPLAASIERYRNDKTKKLRRTDTSSGGMTGSTQ